MHVIEEPAPRVTRLSRQKVRACEPKFSQLAPSPEKQTVGREYVSDCARRADELGRSLREQLGEVVVPAPTVGVRLLD